MWPDSKEKGGREDSPKSRGGGDDSGKGSSKSTGGGKKGRGTKTKLKAIQPADLSAKANEEAAARLEQEIINAAQNPDQTQGFETKTLVELNPVPPSAMYPPQGGQGAPGLMRLPSAGSENMDEKISNLWKSKMLGGPKPAGTAYPQQQGQPAKGGIDPAEKARMEAQQNAMISIVDKMFDTFQNLAFEFNSMARASDLELTWVRPTISRENISSWHQAAQIVTVFTGRISTRLWTMVVRGTLDSVLAYVIPADKLLSFSNQPANFHPVAEIIPVPTAAGLSWSAMGRIVSPDDLANIYRALLDNMIRIAQNDAPSDQWIDLAAYGVELNGPPAPLFDGPQIPPSQALGEDMNYGAKYQQQYLKEDSTSSEVPALPGQAGPAGTGSSAEWRPVVSAVRGANPPVPAIPMPGSQLDNPMPSSPGFNQDEPWKYATGPIVQQGFNSVDARTASGFQSFNGGGGSPGDQMDEPPLPALPAHLFEGLPARPQNMSSGNYGQQQPASSSQFSTGGQQPSPWAPLGGPSTSGVSSTASTSMSGDSGGWKNADVPKPKPGPGGLPPLPVTNQPTQRSGPFSNDLPMHSPAMSDSFSSGNIRVDALAREIANSAFNQPSTVPGFEPYSLDQGKPEPPNSFSGLGGLSQPMPVPELPKLQGAMPIPELPKLSGAMPVPELPKLQGALLPDDPPSAPSPSHLIGLDEDTEDWDDDREENNKPWPKPRPPKAVEETDLYAGGAQPEPAPPAALTSPPKIEMRYGLGLQQNIEPSEPDGQDHNPFLSPEEEAQPAPAQDQEVAALFEGAPVSAPAQLGGPPAFAAPSPAGSPAFPAADAWSGPDPTAPPPASPQPVAGIIPNPFASQPPLLNAAPQESPPPATEWGAPPGAPSPAPPAFSPAATSPVIATPGVDPDSSRKETGRISRAAIEEGFRAAQAAYAQAQAQQGFAGREPMLEPAPLAVPPPEGQNYPTAPVTMPTPEPVAIQSPPYENPPPPDAPAVPGMPAVAGDTAPPSEPTAPVAPAMTAAEQVASGQVTMQQVIDSEVRSLKADIERVVLTMELELEVVSTRGSEAFARRDLKTAERMIKLAETLGEFKKLLVALKEEHEQDLS